MHTCFFFSFIAEAFNITATDMQVRVTRTDVTQEWHGWGQTPKLHVTLKGMRYMYHVSGCW